MIRVAFVFAFTAIATGFLTFGLAAVDIAPLPVLALFLVSGWFYSRAAGLDRMLPSGLTSYACLFVAALLVSLPPSPSPRVELARQTTVVALLAAAGISLLAFGRAARERPNAAVWLGVSFALGAVIGFASSDAGSADPMRAWFQRFLSSGQAEVAVWVTRKSIHVAYYGLFAWVILRALRQSGYRGWLPAVGIPLAHAVFDEFRQLTESKTRYGSPGDVVFDLAGILLALALAGGFARSAKPRAQME